MSELEPYPTDGPASTSAKILLEAAVNAVPIVGGMLAAPLQAVLGYSLESRQTAWFDQLATAIAEHETILGRLPEQLSRDEVIDTVVQATRAAAATSQEEKLAALRHAILHTLADDAPAIDQRHWHIRLVDQFTPSHLRLLGYLDDPVGANTRAGLDPQADFLQPNNVLSRLTVMRRALPDFPDEEWWTLRVVHDLEQAGLVYSGALHEDSTIAAGAYQELTTPNGKEFLAFISPAFGDPRRARSGA